MDIPTQTIIKFSKWKVVWFAAMLFVTVGGTLSLLQGGNMISYVMAVFAIAFGLTSIYIEYWNLLIINKPQFIISIEGIQTNDGQFYEWNKISNEKLQPLGSIKSAWFLSLYWLWLVLHSTLQVLRPKLLLVLPKTVVQPYANSV